MSFKEIKMINDCIKFIWTTANIKGLMCNLIRVATQILSGLNTELLTACITICNMNVCIAMTRNIFSLNPSMILNYELFHREVIENFYCYGDLRWMDQVVKYLKNALDKCLYCAYFNRRPLMKKHESLINKYKLMNNIYDNYEWNKYVLLNGMPIFKDFDYVEFTKEKENAKVPKEEYICMCCGNFGHYENECFLTQCVEKYEVLTNFEVSEHDLYIVSDDRFENKEIYDEWYHFFIENKA